MALTVAPREQVLTIERITGREKTKHFLETLGFFPGEKIKVISEFNGSYIVNVKETRIAIDRTMANRIQVVA